MTAVRRARARRLCVASLIFAAALPGAAAANTLFLIKGGGWGNDVGMSQWGAEGYAVHGWTYRGILAHFYPHTTIVQDASAPPVRVLLYQSVLRVAVRSARPFLVIDARGTKTHLRAFAITSSKLPHIGSRRLTLPALIEPGSEPLSINGKGYRGSLTVRRTRNGFSVVNTVSVEMYLRGVVPSEMPKGWRPQAYETQAVAARSFALASLRPQAQFDLYADGRSQVYKGIAAETPVTNTSVADTSGQVLSYAGHVITAYYDSTSGGHTAAVQDVFTNLAPEPYLVSVTDRYDALSPYHRWHVVVSEQSLAQQFHLPVDDVRVEFAGSGVARQVELLGNGSERTVPARTFEQALGLRSLEFDVCVADLRSTAAVVRAGKSGVLDGFVRDLTGVILQERTSTHGWALLRRIHTQPDGRFRVVVRPWGESSYRLVADHEPGPPLAINVRGPYVRRYPAAA